MKYEKRVTKITVLPEGNALFSELATDIIIEDEAAGEFVRVIQDHYQAENGTILITTDEWPVLSEAIDQMIKDCRDDQLPTEG
jgi:hypothetical protein